MLEGRRHRRRPEEAMKRVGSEAIPGEVAGILGELGSVNHLRGTGCRMQVCLMRGSKSLRGLACVASLRLSPCREEPEGGR